MLSEIGSNFWLSPKDIMGDDDMPAPEIFNCKGDDYVWLSTCRSATSLVINTIEERNSKVNKVVCLPAFTCHTVFEPFIHAGYKVITFPLGLNLLSDKQEILNVIKEKKVGVVLFHRYFGFETLPGIDSIVNQLHDLGVVVIEDCTQSMYSNINRMDADYYVGSIRKWCGVPDGGYAVCKKGKFKEKTSLFDIDLETAKREASEMKYKYLFCKIGDKDNFLSRYREAENILENQTKFYSISPLSIKVQTALDIKWMKEKRRENYKTLLNGLQNIDAFIPIFNEIEDYVVPLYFPILCNERKNIQRILAENSIYAPVVWPKDESCPFVCKEADYIYNHILCIPIDQRYGVDDMERIISVLVN
ncbi:MAG: hypothetical protein IJD84_01465 [Parabacteroides sp.]|nr:hypothetical protein [Parabacteroides sp.]